MACELGFGQGVSVNVHAAASSVRWWGTDFNPAQAGYAQELARVANNKAQLFDQSFAQFCARGDLPDMDFIALHGIWSWISDENRAVLVDFVHRKLKVGGVLYISYNAQPGWAAMVPVRDLLVEHAEVMGSTGQGMVARIDGALAFAERLFAANPVFTRVNPQIPERLKKLGTLNRSYLAHEYFNRDWQPMSITRMAQWLGPAKLSYACSANYLENVEAMNLTPEQLVLLREISDPMFRQSVLDFFVNQQFRKDYWVKGARTLNPLEQVDALRRQQVILATPRAEVTLKAAGLQSEVTLAEAVYAPLLDALADQQPRTLGQLEQAVQARGIGFGQLLQAMMVLRGKGSLYPAQTAAAASAKAGSDRLNQYLMVAARTSKEMQVMASPVTGGGVNVGRFEQLFLLAQSEGHRTPDDWACNAWELLAGQGQRLLKDGKPVDSPEENLAELKIQAQAFAGNRLAILKALQVA